MKRILIDLLLMVLAFTIQTCVFPMIPFLSASPNLLLILTFSTLKILPTPAFDPEFETQQCESVTRTRSYDFFSTESISTP